MWFWHLFKSDLIPEYVRLYIEHSIKMTGDIDPDMLVLFTFCEKWSTFVGPTQRFLSIYPHFEGYK